MGPRKGESLAPFLYYCEILRIMVAANVHWVLKLYIDDNNSCYF